MGLIKKEFQNTLAENAKGEIVFIENVKSGRKGYFCIGCKREMQAVKSKSIHRESYFRHDAEAMKGQQKCTFSDESLRHKRAKEILQIEKRIKVPALYKFPPNGGDLAILIKEAQYIYADSVSLELEFYENENCEILWGKELNLDEKNLLIRPDVTFFDGENNPILFIEIVVSNKVSDEKLIKLRRLGIDTVSVKVPKSSPEEIDKLFHNSRNINWIYSYEQEKFEYFSIPESSSTRIFSTDELEESFFEESFKCRAAQIRGLIQRIRKCLGTESYIRTQRDFESEIQRVERASKKLNSEFREYQINCEKEWRESNLREISKIEDEERTLRDQENKFAQEHSNLETRYFRKRESLEKEERRIDSERTNISGEVGRNRTNLDFRKAEIEREEREIEGNTKREREFIEILKKSGREMPIEFRRKEESERIRFEKSREFFNREEEQIERRRIELRGNFEVEEGRIRENFELRKREITAKLQNEEFAGSELFKGGFDPVIQGRRLLEDFKSSANAIRRSRKAWEAFKRGAYKNWKD